MYRNTEFEDQYRRFTDMFANGITSGEVQSVLNGEEGEGFSQWISQFEDGALALQELQKEGEISSDTLLRLNAQMTGARSKDVKKYGDYTDEVASSLENIAKGGKAAAQETLNVMQQTKKLNNAMVAAKRARGKSGSQMSKEDREQLAEASGINVNDLELMTKEQIDKVADLVEQSSQDEFKNSLGAKVVDGLQSALNSYIQQGGNVKLLLNNLGIEADGEYDLSEIHTIAQSLKDTALADLAAEAGTIGELLVKLTGDDNSLLAELVFSQLTGKGGYKGSTGGGGGGVGKSAAQKLLEQIKHEKELTDHRLKMLQYSESYYEGRGELTNVNTLLGQENTLRKEMIKDEYAIMVETQEYVSEFNKEINDRMHERVLVGADPFGKKGLLYRLSSMQKGINAFIAAHADFITKNKDTTCVILLMKYKKETDNMIKEIL
jgi:hypothetical protein